jgi:DNA polymerase III alpha subunit
MRGFFKFWRACQKANIKPVYGMEAYLCRNRHQRGLTPEQSEAASNGITGKRDKTAAVKEAELTLGVRERFHTCLFAKNDVGLRSLFRLSSIGFLEGFYYRPRIDVAALREHHEGLILSTACVGGILSHLINKQDYEGMLQMLVDLLEIFGEDLYLEVMPHDFPEQRVTNEMLVDLSQKYNIPLLATNDAHYTMADQWQLHETLLAMQSHATWNDPKRWKFVGGHDYYLKTREEMEGSFVMYCQSMSPAVVKQALDNTVVLADSCNVEVVADTKRCLLPHVGIAAHHRDEFLKWAAEVYPESYDLGVQVPSGPCHLDCEAPSSAPYVVGSETSEAAAKALEGKLGGMRQVVLDHVRGGVGLTCEEVETQLEMQHQTAGPRINELVKVGLLYDSGERRKTTSGRMATIWKARV